MNTAAERTQALLESHHRDRDLQWLIHCQRCRADALVAATRYAHNKVFTQTELLKLADRFVEYISGPAEPPR